MTRHTAGFSLWACIAFASLSKPARTMRRRSNASPSPAPTTRRHVTRRTGNSKDPTMVRPGRRSIRETASPAPVSLPDGLLRCRQSPSPIAGCYRLNETANNGASSTQQVRNEVTSMPSAMAIAHTHDRAHHALDQQFARGQQIGVFRIFRLQKIAAVLGHEPLERRLAIDERCHDVTRPR